MLFFLFVRLQWQQQQQNQFSRLTIGREEEEEEEKHCVCFENPAKESFLYYQFLSNSKPTSKMPGTLRLKNVDIVLENETKVFNFGENVHGLLR